MNRSSHRAWFTRPLSGAFGASLLLSSAIAPYGCGRSEREQQALRILSHVDKLRQATSIEQREPLLVALEKEEPTDALAVQTQRSCAAAFRFMQQAEQIEARIRQQVRAPAGPSATAVEIVRDRDILERATAELDVASKKIDEARAALNRCDEAVGQLRLGLR